MRSLDIITNSFKFTIKNYRYLVLSILLLFLYDYLTDELYFFIPTEYYPVTFLLDWFFFCVIIGFIYEVVSRLIKNERVSLEISVHHLTSGFKDSILDAYYFFMAFFIIVIVGILFVNSQFDVLNGFFEASEEFKLNFSLYIWSLTDSVRMSFLSDMFIAMLLFSIIFVVFFTILMIAKIHLEESGSLKQSLNLILMFRKVKHMGYLKFIVTVLSMAVILFIVSSLAGFLNNFFTKSLSLAILESLLIFINLRAVTYVYDDYNLGDMD